MKSKLLLASLFLCGQLIAEQGVEGIFLTSRYDDVIADGRPEVDGIEMMDIDLPGCEESLITSLECYLGLPMTREVAIEIKKTIIDYYIQCGVTMVGVEVPSQLTEGGVIQFLVTRKRVGEIIFCGESFYNSDCLYNYLCVTPGEEISDCVLQSNIAWLNRNPFHYSELRFRATDDPEILDLEICAKRRRALRFFVKGDNTGSARTGYGRIYTGFVWGNAFNRGDIFSFEYQFSNEFKRLQAWTANYTCFLPWQNTILLYGTYAIVKPEPTKPLPTFVRAQKINAQAWQVRPRYVIPFWPYHTCLQQSVMFGFDVKHTNSSIINFVGTTVEVQPPSRFQARSEIYVTQLTGNYLLVNSCCYHEYSLNLNFFLSPFKFLPHQTTRDYDRLRYRSKPKYCYLNATVTDLFKFSCWGSAFLLVRGQVASQTLPPTELFSIGGFDTVRGYHQSEASGDNGVIVNFELRSQEFCLFPCCQGRLTVLAFLDWGLVNNWKIRPHNIPDVKEFPHTQYLLGVGPGLRYTINPYFFLRCDYGFKLHKLHGNTPFLRQLYGGSGQLHIGAIATF